jgi:hypothetical protein
MFESYVGLGHDCEVVAQLRRLTADPRAQVLDWQITDHESLAHVLRTDFADYFQLRNLVRSEDRRHVVDTATGVLIYHLFVADPDGTIPIKQVARQYPKLRARADHLLRRWNETVRSQRATLYVRRDPDQEYTAEQLLEIRDLLRKVYPGHRFALLWVRDTDGGTPDGEVAELDDGLYVTELPVRQPRTEYWKGDDDAWDSLFPKLAALEPVDG